MIMPFFAPLTKEDRKKLKDGGYEELKNCLLGFKDDEGKKWKYDEDDLRWRHVGYFGQGKDRKLVMFDLVDLEEVNGDFDGCVQTQVNHLVN